MLPTHEAPIGHVTHLCLIGSLSVVFKYSSPVHSFELTHPKLTHDGSPFDG